MAGVLPAAINPAGIGHDWTVMARQWDEGLAEGPIPAAHAGLQASWSREDAHSSRGFEVFSCTSPEQVVRLRVTARPVSHSDDR